MMVVVDAEQTLKLNLDSAHSLFGLTISVGIFSDHFFFPVRVGLQMHIFPLEDT